MIDIKQLKKEPQPYLLSMIKRGKELDFVNNLHAYLNSFKEYKKTLKGFKREIGGFKKWLIIAVEKNYDRQKKIEKILEEKNELNLLVQQKLGEERQKYIDKVKDLNKKLEDVKKEDAPHEEFFNRIITSIPNLLGKGVPDGKDESQNEFGPMIGTKRVIINPKKYLELVEKSSYIDLKRGSKVSGSRFGYLIGPMAQLEFALIQYAQEILLSKENGFTMVVPPVLIKEESMAAMGYLNGGGEDETYHLKEDKLYLVGTSEQSIGPMHSGEVFNENDLPRRYLSFSTCFRREAGSYGKDTKGIMRVHQFDKLEMFSFSLPEEADDEHDFFLSKEEELWKGLDIPYRVVKLCAGDLGWPSARTWDIEAWMPGQNTFREVSSTSTTTDYQSRDLSIKVKRANGTKEFVHLLNGTAFAIGRTLIAIIENYQQPDGSILVPEVLRPYVPFKEIAGLNG